MLTVKFFVPLSDMDIKIVERQFGDIYRHKAALADIGDVGVDLLFILG